MNARQRRVKLRTKPKVEIEQIEIGKTSFCERVFKLLKIIGPDIRLVIYALPPVLLLAGLVRWVLRPIQEALINRGHCWFLENSGGIWFYAGSVLLTYALGAVLFNISKPPLFSFKGKEWKVFFLVTFLVTVNGFHHYAMVSGFFPDKNAVFIVKRGLFSQEKRYKPEEIKSAVVFFSGSYEGGSRFSHKSSNSFYTNYQLVPKDGSVVTYRQKNGDLMDLSTFGTKVKIRQTILDLIEEAIVDPVFKKAGAKASFRNLYIERKNDLENDYIDYSSVFHPSNIVNGRFVEEGNEDNNIALNVFSIGYYDEKKTANVIFSIADKNSKRFSNGLEVGDYSINIGSAKNQKISYSTYYEKIKTAVFMMEVSDIVIPENRKVRLEIRSLKKGGQVIARGNWVAEFKLISENEVMEIDRQKMNAAAFPDMSIDKLYLSPLGLSLNATSQNNQDIRDRFDRIELKFDNGATMRFNKKSTASINNRFVFNYLASDDINIQKVEKIVIDGQDIVEFQR